jgi:2'-5' RNA ligase
LRTFIAVDLTENVICKIEKITTYLKTQTPPKTIKWVSSDNLHLTIKFLGEVPEHKLDQIKKLSREAVQTISPFKIDVEGLGMYPNPTKPRVIWLGISNGQFLTEIHNRLDQSLAVMDIKQEQRPFSPHLTIGRIKKSAYVDDILKVGEILSQFKVNRLGTVLVEKIRLYQSELKPQGPIYTPLLDISLNKV